MEFLYKKQGLDSPKEPLSYETSAGRRVYRHGICKIRIRGHKCSLLGEAPLKPFVFASQKVIYKVVVNIKKNEEFHLRLCTDESVKLNEKAKKYGMSKAELLRNYIDDEPIIDTELKELLRNLSKEINKIGTNINQIAKKANESGISRNDILSVNVYQREIAYILERVIENCNNKDTAL